MDRRIAAVIIATAFLVVVLPLSASGLFLRSHLVRIACFVALGGLGLTILMIRGVQWNLARTPLLAVALLGIGYVLGAGRSPAASTSLLGLSHKGAMFALALTVAVLAGERDGRKTLARLTALFLTALSAIALVFGSIQGRLPLTGTPGHANVLAYLIVVLIPLAEFNARESERPWEKRAMWGAVVLSLLVVLLTFSAGALLALAVGWGPTFLFVRNNRKRLGTVLAAGALLLALASAGLLIAGHAVAILPRVHLIQAGLRAVKEAPVTGQGIYSFEYRLPELRNVDMLSFPDVCAQRPIDNVHVEPLNTLVEGGVIAAAGIVLLAMWLLLTAGKAARDRGRWGRTVWRMTVAAMVQGAVSLAPAREGAVALAVVLGVVISLPTGTPRQLPRSLPALLALALIASFPLQWKRVSADRALRLGRDPNVYYGARDVAALQQAARLWPEDLEAPTLLTVTLYRQAMQSGVDQQEKTRLLHRALAWSRHVQRLARQFFKEPILAARIRLALGDPSGALQELDRGDRFVTDHEWQDVRTEAMNSLKNNK